MKKILLVASLALFVSACTQSEQRVVTGAGIGAVGGAIVGAAATGSVEGAAVGAAIGAGTGAVVAALTDRPGYCVWRDQNGREYVDRCP
ncbi:MAG: glycine zipper domain-containing protein [Pseudomonadota bacterium]